VSVRVRWPVLGCVGFAGSIGGGGRFMQWVSRCSIGLFSAITACIIGPSRMQLMSC
jgi:hypothetical protein